MDLERLPAPIAYVRHLVDVEYDDRAKFDQLRVLAQNMLQLMASILINDCLRLNLVGKLATPPTQKKLVAGDFATIIGESASALISTEELTYVPELVRLYGQSGKATRQRKARLYRIVEYRNRDAHTASLAQTSTWLQELNSDVDQVLEELEFLRTYMMVATKSVELTPDRSSSRLNGVRCHGVSHRYIPIQIPIEETVSRSEVILIKVDRSDWLSLRPWFLFLDSDGLVGGSGEELTLLNQVSERRLDYIGLVSGEEYRPDNNWRAYTVYDSSFTQVQPSQEVEGIVEQDLLIDTPAVDTIWDNQLHTKNESSILHELNRLAESCEGIVIQEDNKSLIKDYFVLVRTPVREVIVATVDETGEVWIYPKMLERAVTEGLISNANLDDSSRQLDPISMEQIAGGIALLNIGNLSERSEWLCNLASKFSV